MGRGQRKYWNRNKAHKNEPMKLIRTAAIITLAGNAVLAALKLAVGFISGSSALIGDGIDSTADVLIGIAALFVVRVISKPADAEHPWGHGRAETVATAFLSFVIFFAGAQLIISSVPKLFTGETGDAPSAIALVVTLCSIGGKAMLAWGQHRLGKRSGSSMIQANAKNMAGDMLISAGVLVGLVISTLTGSAYADHISALLIGAWIIKTAVSIFWEANRELMDGNHDIKPYRAIVDAVGSVKGASNPHRARMRRIAGFWDIDLDIDVDPRCTIMEAHGIAAQVESAIKQRLDNVYDIMIHVEPRGDSAAERYGLSEDEMNG